MEDIYTLPEITFVAGENQTLIMHLKTPLPRGEPFNANSCTIDFSLINYSNKNGSPVLSKLCSLREDTDGVPSIAVVTLSPSETVALFGKFVYQVSIVDIDNEIEIPNQGILFITKNINQGFIQSHVT